MPDKGYKPIIKKYLPQIQKMRLLDDDFMRAVFDDNKEGTEAVLKIIMGRDDIKVEEVRAQQELKNLYGRSVRLDIYATDASGKQYDIEIQRANEGAGEKRARYNQSIMDTNHLPAGSNPKSLPEVYVIFFTESDVRGRGLPLYHVERVVQETGELFDDGEHIIYVNGAYEGDGSVLGTLIADFREPDPTKIKTKALAERMKYLKQSEEGVGHMCEIMENIVRKERQEAAREAAQEAAKETRRKEFLRLIKRLWSKPSTLADMVFTSERSEEEVIAALKELGLSIPN